MPSETKAVLTLESFIKFIKTFLILIFSSIYFNSGIQNLWKKKTKYHVVVFLFFNSVYIQQSLEITDAKKKNPYGECH